ncbi:MAG: hypothetical protein JWP01_2948 [Myxococcales bacterium]|nr:hypothetical protein [Myxococcales bacterium]
MSVETEASRIQRLTARVRWCDRHRRWVTICAALVISPILITRLDQELGAHWPLFHSVMMSVMLGAFVWWFAEVILAWVTAVWETEADELTRDRGLPRAELIVRRN